MDFGSFARQIQEENELSNSIYSEAVNKQTVEEIQIAKKKELSDEVSLPFEVPLILSGGGGLLKKGAKKLFPKSAEAIDKASEILESDDPVQAVKDEVKRQVDSVTQKAQKALQQRVTGQTDGNDSTPTNNDGTPTSDSGTPTGDSGTPSGDSSSLTDAGVDDTKLDTGGDKDDADFDDDVDTTFNADQDASVADFLGGAEDAGAGAAGGIESTLDETALAQGGLDPLADVGALVGGLLSFFASIFGGSKPPPPVPIHHTVVFNPSLAVGLSEVAG